MPDLYQGAEGWDFSLVDPDNRRPVDYASRQAALQASGGLSDLLSSWRDGRAKQRVIAAALGLRRRWPQVFSDGDYRPLEVESRHHEGVVAFLRRAGNRAVLIAAPLRCSGAVDAVNLRLDQNWLGEARLELPPDMNAISAVDSFSGEKMDLRGLNLARLFGSAPVALLELS